MSNLWIITFAQGILGIIGAVFCSYPTFVYFCGSLFTACFITESFSELFLIFNRFLSILAPKVEKMAFDGYKIYFWFLLSASAGFFAFMHLKPVLFNATHFAWLFNPYVDYIEDVDLTIF
uniref:Uncharacterized protein n=1 Tax=Ditylenchus dipsaci TaxID=166011 RepID=A0A915EF01_9BILA